ncbi:MAG: TIR domain-containing protein [Pseudomonadota bacterium]
MEILPDFIYTVSMDPSYVAFFSYARADDVDGILTDIRRDLESEIQLRLGESSVQVFQDRDDIEPGEEWERRLETALKEAVFLVPVITPYFYSSSFCRTEFLRFLHKARAQGEDARIVPIYWRKSVAPESEPEAIEVEAAIGRLQHLDWRPVRRQEVPATEMINELAQLLAKRYSEVRKQMSKAAGGEQLSIEKRDYLTENWLPRLAKQLGRFRWLVGCVAASLAAVVTFLAYQTLFLKSFGSAEIYALISILTLASLLAPCIGKLDSCNGALSNVVWCLSERNLTALVMVLEDSSCFGDAGKLPTNV